MTHCRGGVTADAIGMAKMGPNERWGIRGGFMHSRSAQARTRKKPQENVQETKNTKHTTMYPASGPSCGGNTPTAALS